MASSSPAVPATRFTHPAQNLPTPVAANYFYFAYLGTDVELLVGFLDLPQVVQTTDAARASGATEIEFKPEILARVVMSQAAFSVLKSQLEDIAKRMATPAAEAQSGGQK